MKAAQRHSGVNPLAVPRTAGIGLAMQFIMAILLLSASATADAATKYWFGSSTGACPCHFSDNARWSTTAAPTYTATTAPGSADIATFDGNHIDDLDITANTSVAGINIAAGYTGTITQNAGVTLTVGTSNFSQAAGTFSGGTGTITLNGNLTISGGTFNQTGAGTLNLTGYSKTYNTGSTTLNNVTINTTGNATITGTMTVGGLFTVTSVYSLGGTVAALGDVNITDTSIVGTGTLLISGTGAQTLNIASLPASGILDINKPSGTATLGSALSISTATTFNLISGGFDTGAYNINWGTGNFTMSGGTLSGTSTITLKSNLTISGGTFNQTGAGTLNLTGYSKTYNTGSTTLNNVTINTTGNATITGTMTVGGLFTVTSVYSLGGTVAALGDVNITDTSIVGTGTLLISGTGAQTLNIASVPASGTLDINKPSGTATLGSALSTTTAATFNLISGGFDTGANNINWGTGNFNMSGGTLSGTSTITLKSNLTISGGTFNQTGSGRLNLTAYSATYNTGSAILNNVTINSGNSAAITGTMTVGGEFRVTAVYTMSGTVAALGDVNITDTSILGTASIQVVGSGAQILNVADVPRSSTAFIINKPSGTATLGSNYKSSGSGVDLTVTSGTLDLNGYNLSLAGAGILTIDAAATLKLIGSETVTASTKTFNLGSTVIYYGTVGPYAVNAWNYQNLTFNGSGGTFNLTAAQTIAQNLTIAAGTFDINGNNLTVAGAFSNLDTLRLKGTETVGLTMDTTHGTVIYNGSTAITGLMAGNTYNNLVFNGTGGSWTLNAALTVNGNLTLTAGTLDVSASNYAITITGNFNNGGGTLTPRNGTVTLNGTNQTISGNTAFYNLTKSVATADTLSFAAGSTTTVNGLATLNGAAGQLLSLRSSSTPTRWHINFAGTKSITYIDVQDSDASGSATGNKPVQPTNSNDSGNNLEWFPSPIITVTKISAVISDPINNTVNPKRVPGAVIEVTISPANSGSASPDANTTYVTDIIDNTTMSFDVTTGITFSDGTTSSGLSLGTVSYSNTAAPGPYVFGYTPVPDGQGYDGNVTAIKITTTGTFAFGGTPSPSFSVKYKAKMQ